MKPRILARIALASALIVSGACGETRTPTEPGPAATVYTPAPTPVSGAPAQLAGRVTWGSGYAPDAGVIVECQGRSTTTAADGTYRFEGLSSTTEVTITFREPGDPNPLKATAPLYPGANTFNFDMG